MYLLFLLFSLLSTCLFMLCGVVLFVVRPLVYVYSVVLFCLLSFWLCISVLLCCFVNCSLVYVCSIFAVLSIVLLFIYVMLCCFICCPLIY